LKIGILARLGHHGIRRDLAVHQALSVDDSKSVDKAAHIAPQ
jgi:hypothetical protein